MRRRSVYTAANTPSTALGTPPCFRSEDGGRHDGDSEGARIHVINDEARDKSPTERAPLRSSNSFGTSAK